MYDSAYRKYLEYINIETKSRIEVTRVGERGNEELLFNGFRVFIEMMKVF